VLDELNRLKIEFISFREQIDTGGPAGRAVVVIIGAIAELERNLIIERVRAGMRRAKLEGRHIGRKPLVLDRAAILRDRARGQSLGQLAKTNLVSRATIHRVPKEHAATSSGAVSKGLENATPQTPQNQWLDLDDPAVHKVWVMKQKPTNNHPSEVQLSTVEHP